MLHHFFSFEYQGFMKKCTICNIRSCFKYWGIWLKSFGVMLSLGLLALLLCEKGKRYFPFTSPLQMIGQHQILISWNARLRVKVDFFCLFTNHLMIFINPNVAVTADRLCSGIILSLIRDKFSYTLSADKVIKDEDGD